MTHVKCKTKQIKYKQNKQKQIYRYRDQIGDYQMERWMGVWMNEWKRSAIWWWMVTRIVVVIILLCTQMLDYNAVQEKKLSNSIYFRPQSMTESYKTILNRKHSGKSLKLCPVIFFLPEIWESHQNLESPICKRITEMQIYALTLYGFKRVSLYT